MPEEMTQGQEQFRVSRDPRVESRIELLKQIVFPTPISKQTSFKNEKGEVETTISQSPYFLLNTKEYGLAELGDFEIGTVWFGYTIVSDALAMGLDDFAEKFSGEILNYLMLTRSRKGLQIRHLLKEYSEQKIVTAEEQNKNKGVWGNALGNK